MQGSQSSAINIVIKPLQSSYHKSQYDHTLVHLLHVHKSVCVYKHARSDVVTPWFYFPEYSRDIEPIIPPSNYQAISIGCSPCWNR